MIEILWHVLLLQTCDVTCFSKNVMLTSKYLRHQFSTFEAMFTPYQRAPSPVRKPHRIELLFRHKNGDFGAISVKNQASCAVPISKVERHILDKFCALFLCCVNGYSDRSGSE